ncbi:MAG TPA: hypothetical protein PK231_09585 [Acidocella sp.]|nr:hypothetical protein [Acidocella sp.]
MNFIFMLTRDDRTIPNCLDIIEQITPLNLRHIGFKDIGADLETLRTLNQKIQASGAASYLEVVATSPEAALNSARMAVEIGVNRLLGGTMVAETLEILHGGNITYYPFPGTPTGHPTKLGGTPAQIHAHTSDFLTQGCAGVDLLAYRATEAEPVALIEAARKALGDKTLIVAGDINSPERITAVRDAGADAFTIGSAAFNLSFCPATTLTGQLQAIMACVG